LKIKQQNLQSFEFFIHKNENSEINDEVLKSEKDFFAFYEKNAPIFSGHILIFNYITENLQKFLKENKICYIDKEQECNLSVRKKDSLEEIELLDSQEKKLQNSPETETEEQKIKIITNSNISKYKFQERAIIRTPIRSGEYIETENDLVIFSRINNGAEIISSGNMEIFGEIHGKIECNGEYIIVSQIGKLGSVIFNGVILDNNKFKNRKQLISLTQENTLKYEEL
jgi:septum site-determining protein MinC